MADFQRTTIPDFVLYNPAYALATVTVYTIDANGASTGTLATLYAGITGTDTLENPQTLDSGGKWQAPVYVDEAVLLEVSGLDAFTDHSTGVFYPRTNPEFVDDSQAAANRAIVFAERAQAAAARAERAVASFGADYLEKANNLSDLTNAATARTNLGVRIGVDVQGYDDRILPVTRLYLAQHLS